MTGTFVFCAFLATPVVLWIANRFLLGQCIHWSLMWLLATVSCYFILLLGVYLVDSQLEAELYKHDLDGDRSFSGAEDTPAMREAMERFTNDTGRALAPITGVPISIVWVILNYVPLGLISLAIWRFRSRRGDFDLGDDHTEFASASTPPENGPQNPYQPPRSNPKIR